MSTLSSSYHPALTVTNNIKNQVPLTLDIDMDTESYSSWVELFRSTCTVYNVLDHIDSTCPRPSDVDTPMWLRLDCVVKQWIYRTISTQLLQTILKPNATAYEVWTTLEQIFNAKKFPTDLINNSVVNNNNESNNTSNEFVQIGSATARISEGQEERQKCVKKRNVNTNTNTLGDAEVIDDATTKRKKQRVIWTPQLHAKFVAAVNHLGTSRAVPKKILEIMNIPGLTRENVASHLQKYRQYHKRLDQTSQHPSKSDAKMMCSTKESLQKLSSMKHHNNFQTQTMPSSSSSSSSLQLGDFKTLNNSHGTYNEQYGHQHNIQMTLGEITGEANMNLRVVHHVESGNANVIFPISSYNTRSTLGSKVHVLETPWSEMGLNTFVNGEINSIDAYGNYAFDLGYNDATALYMEQ